MKNQRMNKSLLQVLLAVGITGVACRSGAVVQTSSEVWVGSDTTVQGNGGSGFKYTFFAQRMIRPLETAGTVGLVQNAVLTDTNGTWADGQFGTNGVRSYVEFDNGWMADIADCSAANHCLTLAGSIGSAASAGNAYRIHKHFTVADMFGPNNETGLKSGLNPTTADNILLVVPETQQTVVVFYYDDGTYHGWLNALFLPADKQIIYPEQGVIVRRRATQDVPLYMVGPVKTGSAVVTVDSGYNLLGTMKSATAMPLTSLNLYSGDPTTGMASGLNPTTSDNLLVVRPDGSTAVYFYYKDSYGEGWLDALFNLSNSVQIQPGTAFYIHRRSNTGFNWTIPAE